ncbi:MAG: hypothetical protein JRJ59_08380 [Deltaproteobacteria bacterium]|nr:hypothetical protein [Deltaproteobacteria bacterium]
MKGLFESGTINRVKDLLNLSEEQLAEAVASRRRGVTKKDRERLKMAHSLYMMLHQKYHTDAVGLEGYLDQLQVKVFSDLDQLRTALRETDCRQKLNGLLDYLEALKDLILSPTIYDIHEDIYYKRHIAVDIPSMYGSYHEAKFDALGLTFRLESLVNTLFQELIDGLDLKLITRATFAQILDYLRLFDRALRLDGINSREMERQIDLLTHSLDVRGFSLTQYLDIFRGFSRVVSNIVNDHFNNIHHNQMVKIVAQTPAHKLLPKYLPAEGSIDAKEMSHRVNEIFLRDLMAKALGLQQLDLFVTRILNTLFHQDRKLPRNMLRRLLDYDPDRAISPLDPVHPDISDIVHLGAKGLNLVRIKALGLPVPPGFILTTDVFRCREVFDHYPPAKDHFRNLVAEQLRRLEKLSGKKFGDPKNPLLLSVRSGSSISQPGMMSTFLNVGINEKIAEGMAAGGRGRKWFAWDCYRRFLQTFGMAQGLHRNDFDAIMVQFKQRFGLPFKQDFSGAQMKECALAYEEFIKSHGLAIEPQPFEQLYLAIQGVFDSWNSAQARTYRKIMGISSDWGTAVTVQAMVFGNISREAGSGVFFTHNPRWSGDKLMLWGDFTLGNQGEDVVSGLVKTLPINQQQAQTENRPTSITLETSYPEIYKTLREAAKNMIYNWGYSPQEMEFTFEGPRAADLYFLQSRDMVLRERSEAHGVPLSEIPSGHFLGRGIGVSGGGMTGRLVFSLGEINAWRQKEPETPLILIRGDTVPDDIREIHAADGLLTARGGSTSHAAIVARQLNKTCIVGCAELICNEDEKTASLGRMLLKSGDWISIDGFEGSIYQGQSLQEAEIKERKVVES